MFRLVCLFILFFGVGCNSVSRQELPQPPDGKPVSFHPLMPQIWKLSNGIEVYFLPDDEIPVVRGSLIIPGGTLWKFGPPGSIEVMGHQMRQGGAGTLSADQLDLELEKLAAAVTSGYGSEYGTFGFSCLESDFDRVLSIVGEVVRHPRFQQDRLDLWKGQALESVRRRTDDPSTVASIAFKELVFGGTPLGEVLVDEDIGRISRLDLLRAHRLFVRPNGAVFAITGKIDPHHLHQRLEQVFGDWQVNENDIGEAPSIEPQSHPGIYFIEQPFSQSTVYAGHVGPQRLSHDQISIEVFNSIFGSGDFGSRLMKRIRTELGLAYAVFGGVLPGFPVGQTLMVLQTKSETTSHALQEAFRSLANISMDPVSTEELELAKKSIENSFVFRFDSPDDLVRRTVLLKLLKYPKDYDETYLDRVRAVSDSDIMAVANKRWFLDKLVVVVVGNESAYNGLIRDLQRKDSEFPFSSIHRCRFGQKLEGCTPPVE